MRIKYEHELQENFEKTDGIFAPDRSNDIGIQENMRKSFAIMGGKRGAKEECGEAIAS